MEPTVYKKGQGGPPAPGPSNPPPQGPVLAARPRRSPAWLRAIGNSFYEIGFATEYWLIQTGRVLRNVFFAAVQFFSWLLGTLFGWVGALAMGIWRDITVPFRSLSLQRRRLREVRDKARQAGLDQTDVPGYTRVRVKSHLRFAATIVSSFLPLVAVAILILTVRNVVNFQYGLAVEVDGQILGYVADQTVVDGAKSLLRDRLRLAENQEAGDWQFTPTYTLARVSSYTTTQQLVNEILRSGSQNPGDITEATGLYIGTGENQQLYAVTDSGAQLEQYLDNYLQQKQAEYSDEYTVSFSQALTYDAESEEVFFTSSVMDWDDLLDRLNSNVSEAVTVTADGEATLEEIATANQMDFGLLLQRNPALAGLGAEDVPEAGETITLQNAQPFLQVQAVNRVQSIEEIPYQTMEEYNPNQPFGTRRVLQNGIVGQQEVWDDYVWVDGELRDRLRVDELTHVIQPAQARIVEVGTNEETKTTVGEYMFPVPSSTWSSRGISGAHRGLDINAKTGEPIYAARGGRVITAGWHYSYGWHVVIDHGDGMVTLYAHCSQLYVEAGQYVEQGEAIGAIGSTGDSTGPHLHIEFQYNGQLMDPLNYFTVPAGYNRGRQ